MEQHLVQYIHRSFKKLIDSFGFTIASEINDGQTYSIEYASEVFALKIEKYFREFYATVYRIDQQNRAIDLFNLLEYLMRSDENVPRSAYFRKEKHLEDSFKQQFNHLSAVIYDHYPLLNEFFSADDYKTRLADFEKYWRGKHPELYKNTRK